MFNCNSLPLQMCTSVALSGAFQSLIKEIKALQNEQEKMMRELSTNFFITEQILAALLDPAHEYSLSNGDSLDLHILKRSNPDITVCKNLLQVLLRLKECYGVLLRLTENTFLNSARIANMAFLIRIFLAHGDELTPGKIKFALGLEVNGLGGDDTRNVEGRNIGRYIGNASIHVHTNSTKVIANKLFITLKMDLNRKYDDLDLIRLNGTGKGGKMEERLYYMFKSRKRRRFGKKKRVRKREGMLKKIEKELGEKKTN